MELEEIVRKVVSNTPTVCIDTLADGTVTYSAEDDDGGICIWYREDDDGLPVLHLENIVSYRPGRGTEMMQALIAACRHNGYARIEAVVFPLVDNPRFWHYQRLLSWYEHLGFRYERPCDEEAAQIILAQPGEMLVDEYPEGIFHPRMVLCLN